MGISFRPSFAFAPISPLSPCVVAWNNYGDRVTTAIGPNKGLIPFCVVPRRDAHTRA
jgi:hypothetical protein